MSHQSITASLLPWLETLVADELRALLIDIAGKEPAIADRLDTIRLADSGDHEELLALVNRTLTPTRRFYDYWQANAYASECYDTVEMLAAASESATAGLITVIERAITLTTRAILRSDDSSGLQGDLVHTLLQAHARAVRVSTPPLTQREQTRLITWLVKYRYSGAQDFFDPDIVAYAPGLSEKSIAQYRQAISSIDLGPYGSYPLTRLAVLDRDRQAIVSAHGGEPGNGLVARAIVDDLEEAGLHDDAVEYARLGLKMAVHAHDDRLVVFLVEHALMLGDSAEAVRLRRDWFRRFPSLVSFSRLRTVAEGVGRWEAEREPAEQVLAERDPASFVSHLLDEDRDDEAWSFARRHLAPDARIDIWTRLCEHRARTHPQETLPVYRRVVTDTLQVTDKRNYRAAASLLKTMRSVSDAGGTAARAEFDLFLADTAERNRRRPTCIEAFRRAGLLSDRR